MTYRKILAKPGYAYVGARTSAPQFWQKCWICGGFGRLSYTYFVDAGDGWTEAHNRLRHCICYAGSFPTYKLILRPVRILPLSPNPTQDVLDSNIL